VTTQCKSCDNLIDDLIAAESLVGLIKVAREADIENPAVKNGPRCANCRPELPETPAVVLENFKHGIDLP